LKALAPPPKADNSSYDVSDDEIPFSAVSV
jgi:hypothetical protein